MNSNTDQIPAGYRRDHRGRLWPENTVKPLDALRDEMVCKLHAEAVALHQQLASFQERAMGEIAAFLELSHTEYGVRRGGRKGNVRLLSFDGELRVELVIAESIAFDERLAAAKRLIDECLREWAEGTPPELRALVEDAFRVDQHQQLRPTQILSLRRYDITDPRWLEAMRAIAESVQVTGTKAYLRFSQRTPDGAGYRQLALDLPGLGKE